MVAPRFIRRGIAVALALGPLFAPGAYAQQIDNCWLGVGVVGFGALDVIAQVNGLASDASSVCQGLAGALAPPRNPRAGQLDSSTGLFIEQVQGPVWVWGSAPQSDAYTTVCSVSVRNTDLVISEQLRSDGSPYGPTHIRATALCSALGA